MVNKIAFEVVYVFGNKGISFDLLHFHFFNFAVYNRIVVKSIIYSGLVFILKIQD